MVWFGFADMRPGGPGGPKGPPAPPGKGKGSPKDARDPRDPANDDLLDDLGHSPADRAAHLGFRFLLATHDHLGPSIALALRALARVG